MPYILFIEEQASTFSEENNADNQDIKTFTYSKEKIIYERHFEPDRFKEDRQVC